MKYIDNIQAVAVLQPDYLGFIFYDKSKRNFDGIIPELSASIKKTGVFVNASIDEVVNKINQYDLQAVQLHGDESVAYIKELKDQFEHTRELEVIKVFGIKESFNFNILKPYESVVDYFLFDTKGKERGGNGVAFDWKVLRDYPFSKPFFLSGGIGLENTDNILSFLRRQESNYCYALDVNSKFEVEAGLKSVEKIKEFKENVITNKVK